MLQFVFFHCTDVLVSSLLHRTGSAASSHSAGQLNTGEVVTPGAPSSPASMRWLTSPANARVEICERGGCFEARFECGPRNRSSSRSPTPSPCPEGPVSVEFDNVRFGLPVGGQSLPASRRGGFHRAPRRRGGAVNACPSGSSRGRPLPSLVRPVPASPQLRNYSLRLYDVDSGAAPLRGRMFAMSHSFHASQPGHGCHAGTATRST
jgi:ATP-binding cassette subfamily C protein